MSCVITTIWSAEQHRLMNEDATAKGFAYDDRRIFPPGSAWYESHLFDPTGEWQKAGHRSMIAFEKTSIYRWMLSEHYWRDWSTTRPPIAVVCPNGQLWQIDRPSFNGNGWQVDIEAGKITCSPSIVVPGYHGYLRQGVFSADLEGRGPNGSDAWDTTRIDRVL